MAICLQNGNVLRRSQELGGQLQVLDAQSNTGSSHIVAEVGKVVYWIKRQEIILNSPGIACWTTADAVKLPTKVYVEIIAHHMKDLATDHLALGVAQLLQKSTSYYINNGIT